MFLVIVCNGSLTGAECRRMDRETGAMDGPYPGYRGAGACGGAMVRMSDPNDRAPSHRARAAVYPNGPRLAGASLGAGAVTGGPDETFARPRGAWRGAGGRWLLWPLRAVLWAALLIIVYRGVTAIVANDTSSAPDSASLSQVATSDQFPATLAEAYALAFGQVYLNFNPAVQAQREQELAAFVPPSLADSATMLLASAPR